LGKTNRNLAKGSGAEVTAHGKKTRNKKRWKTNGPENILIGTMRVYIKRQKEREPRQTNRHRRWKFI